MAKGTKTSGRAKCAVKTSLTLRIRVRRLNRIKEFNLPKLRVAGSTPVSRSNPRSYGVSTRSSVCPSSGTTVKGVDRNVSTPTYFVAGDRPLQLAVMVPVPPAVTRVGAATVSFPTGGPPIQLDRV